MLPVNFSEKKTLCHKMVEIRNVALSEADNTRKNLTFLWILYFIFPYFYIGSKELQNQDI